MRFNLDLDGEVIVTRDTFARLREKFVDNKGKKYKNPRNFAAGSIRLHDSSKAAERGLQFVAWKFVKGSDYRHFSSRLNHLDELGFNVTPYTELVSAMNEENYQVGVDMIQSICDKYNYPIDGCVFSFNECEYMDSLGFTSHHSKAQIAYKFYDEKYDRSNFIKNVMLDNILPGDIYLKARELRFNNDATRVVLLIRLLDKSDVSVYDVVQNLFPDKTKDFVINISESDIALVKEVKSDIDGKDLEKLARSIVDTLSGEFFTRVNVGIGTAATGIKDLAKSFKELYIASGILSKAIIISAGNNLWRKSFFQE